MTAYVALPLLERPSKKETRYDIGPTGMMARIATALEKDRKQPHDVLRSDESVLDRVARGGAA